ncbi:hypothetical protein [Alienimonas californiensis]|uniref:Uncharacterized protein n=1 Tax=Alienimonas californiensis TaxID=2527989 RepID=A0A517PCL2_9PLAN|nr:hypothetical protein [Alienimonas californiensis]QDT17110.1 hypothetical protein CA12_32220 [Alienimonas californiensis]
MNRHLCGVGLILTDSVVSTSAYGLGLLTMEAAAFAAGVSLAGILLTAHSIADRLLPRD